MPWWLTTLLSALALATSDALIKRHLSGASVRAILIFRFGLAGLMTGALWLSIPGSTDNRALWYWMAWLTPLEIAAMLLYIQAIRAHDLSMTLPYLALTPAFTLLTGWLLLSEWPGAIPLAGILAVTLGAWMMNADARHGGWLAPLHAIARHPGARAMVGVAAIYSLTAVIGKRALADVHPLHLGAMYFVPIGIGALLIGLPRGAQALQLARQHSFAVIGVAAMMAVMVLSHFIAIDQTQTSYMIAVKRISLVFGMLYGVMWFREYIPGHRWLAASCMLCGAVLISL